MHPVLAEIFGPDLIIVIIVVALVLFGGTQIPKLARSLGSAQSEFKKGLAEGQKAGDAAPAAEGGTPPANGTAPAPGAAPAPGTTPTPGTTPPTG
ncbi:MAG TPA: twin-arginine translocase TatA/TatE family subunit [Acidimicrobiaceae bacterium]|nr:twin-arginine translocase TatA/TatE family subunit [Acidimicrobiaceae bacterium]